MVDRLRADESGMLLRDGAGSPWHVTEVTLLAGDGLTAAEVLAHVAERIAYTPRFRQRVEEGLAGDTWVDDQDFDLAGHVRQAPLPDGASLAQVQDFVSELLHSPLNRHHPRWEIGVVRSLKGRRSALITRVHPAWVDGIAHVHLLQELLDDTENPDAPVPAAWTPTAAPAGTDEALAAVTDLLRDPARSWGALGSALGRLTHRGTGQQAASRPRPSFVGGTGASLESLERVARHHGCTVHDVVLALIVGGLHRRGERHEPVALVPRAVAEGDAATALGFAVAADSVVLPVRAEEPADRLEQVASLTRTRTESGRLVSPERVEDLPGFAPATLHAVAARQAVAGRPHEVLIAHVPGPRTPRWLGLRPVKASYPVIGLTEPQRLTVGVTSLSGQVWFGLCGVEPVAELATGIVDELQALLAPVGEL